MNKRTEDKLIRKGAFKALTEYSENKLEFMALIICTVIFAVVILIIPEQAQHISWPYWFGVAAFMGKPISENVVKGIAGTNGSKG